MFAQFLALRLFVPCPTNGTETQIDLLAKRFENKSRRFGVNCTGKTSKVNSNDRK